ncbi:MAG: Gfo/Idh/MocA family oxidoreductase [Victivallales bacterium]|nr:Gfo/Idh/MocA family oxidoreductase [Victivallales bacterium]
MKNGKYCCAVWGCGWVASGHINAYLKHPDCIVTAIGSRRIESVRAKKAEFGLDCKECTSFQDILNDKEIDIISICTPNCQHAEETILAAQAGKHVFVEKPIAIDENDIPKMIEAVEQNNIRSMVGFILRFNPLVNLQRKLVAEGELGKVFMTNMDYWFGRERKGWMKHKEQTGGASILAGCHSLDMARYIIGADFRRVSAQSIMVGDYYEYPPVETAQVQYTNGALGVFTCSLVGTNPYTANISILGEKGTIMNDRFYLKRFEGQADFFTLDTGVKKSGDVYAHPFPAMVAHFIDCIKSGKESPHNLRSAINAHLTTLAIRKSAEANGRAVIIDGCKLKFED